MKKLFLFAFLLSMIVGCKCGTSKCQSKKCADFENRREAQEAFDNDKKCYKNLDRDGDGKVCESLPE